MQLVHYPPAVSKIALLETFRNFAFSSRRIDLNAAILDRLGVKAVYSCNSWVGALALFLKELARGDTRSQVILPRYSCYEFTLAIQLAGLIPVYVDVELDFRMSVPEVRKTINVETLAILVVNNVGIFSDLDALRETAGQTVCLIEDATYTLFGSYRGRTVGTIGDVAILNFSEGKAVPIGGGALVLNNLRYRAAFERCQAWLQKKPKPGNLRGFFNLVVYWLGTSLWIYSAYRVIKALLRVDLKEKVSMEISRRRPEEMRKLSNSCIEQERVTLISQLTEPISRIQQCAAMAAMRNADARRQRRLGIAKKYSHLLNGNDRIRQFKTTDEMFMLRFPVVCNKLDVEKFSEYQGLGLSRLYGPDSELNIDNAKEKNSLFFFQNLLTLPTYESIDDHHIHKVIQALQEIAGL